MGECASDQAPLVSQELGLQCAVCQAWFGHESWKDVPCACLSHFNDGYKNRSCFYIQGCMKIFCSAGGNGGEDSVMSF